MAKIQRRALSASPIIGADSIFFFNWSHLYSSQAAQWGVDFSILHFLIAQKSSANAHLTVLDLHPWQLISSSFSFTRCSALHFFMIFFRSASLLARVARKVSHLEQSIPQYEIKI